MFYEISAKCPHCGERHLTEPEYPEEIISIKCGSCKKEFVYKLDIKAKLTYYTRIKK